MSYPQPPGWGPQGPPHGYPPPGYGPPGYGPPGYPPPPPKGTGLGIAAWIGIGTVIFVLVVAIARAPASKSSSRDSDRDSSSEKSPRDAKKTERPPEPEPEPKPAIDVTVTAGKLWSSYQANEVAADQAYKGKVLFVSGKVAGIDKDFMDNIVVKLATTNQFMSIMATVKDSEKSKAAKLAKGGDVSLLCEGGGMIIGSPILRDCTIE